MSDEKPYQNIQLAILWAERAIPNVPTIVEEALRVGASPKECVEQCILGHTHYMDGQERVTDAMLRLMRELQHPEFLQWVAWKLGAM